MSRTGTTSDHTTCAPSRAARELGLKRREFDLAVNLGLIRTVPDEGGGGPRVALADSLSGLQVDAEAMARNLRTLTRGEPPDLGHAVDLVDHFLKGRR